MGRIFKTMITAHSGCDDTKDNSMSYIQHALTLPVDAFEVDVYEVNGEYILSHDLPDKEDHVLLKDVFACLQKHEDMKINCDLKQKGLQEKIYVLACEYGLEERLMFSGETDIHADKVIRQKTLLNAEILVPDIYRRNHVFRYEDAEMLIQKCREAGFSCLNVDHRYITDSFVKLAKKENIELSLWTVNHSEDIKRMLAYHPYNITSRKPLNVLSILKETVCSNI